jgi:UDP-N-acetylmuramate-alanine ligase
MSSATSCQLSAAMSTVFSLLHFIGIIGISMSSLVTVFGPISQNICKANVNTFQAENSPTMIQWREVLSLANTNKSDHKRAREHVPVII